MSRDVVVTGVGAVSPLGVGADVLFGRWCAGADGISEGVARCVGFDPREHFSTKELRRTDRFAQLAVAAAEEARERAGWIGGMPYDPFRMACVIGTGVGGEATFEDGLDEFRSRGGAGVSPLMVPRLMGNAAAAIITMRWGLRGPSAAIASACASGADAIAAGARLIRTGEADAAVVGGAESAISQLMQTAFRSMGATSPSGRCRPFDARRDGFVLGEAAGVLLLEDGEAAELRGAPVLGRLVGIGTSSDAHHLTAPDETAKGPARAISAALADAGVVAEEIDYVNAHGTATRLNDRVETKALKVALGRRAWRVPVSSTKSAIGHTLGAAGAIEAAVTLLALRAEVAPPTVGYEVMEGGLDLDYVGEGCVPLDPNGGGARYGISNSFGFGGHNVVLVLEAPPHHQDPAVE